MTLVDLQILVKECANARYEARGFTQKDFASSQISQLNNL